MQYHIWSCCDQSFWSSSFANSCSYGDHDPQISEMLNTASVSLMEWQNFPSCISEWRCGSKTVILPIFGHVATLTFDIWTTNFHKCSTLPQLVFSIKINNKSNKSYGLVYLKGVVAPETIFAHIWSSGVLDFWPLDLKLSGMINTTQMSFFIDKSSCLIYINGVTGPALYFCPYLVIWWHRPFDPRFSKILNSALTSLWKMFPPGTLILNCGPKPVFMPIFGQVVSLTFDLWTSNYQKC